MAAGSGPLVKVNMDDPQKLMTIRAARVTSANRAKVVASDRLLQMRDGRMNPGKAAAIFFASCGNKKKVGSYLPQDPANAGYPVRRGFSVQSPLPLEYWITRFRG